MFTDIPIICIKVRTSDPIRSPAVFFSFQRFVLSKLFTLVLVVFLNLCSVSSLLNFEDSCSQLPGFSIILATVRCSFVDGGCTALVSSFPVLSWRTDFYFLLSFPI